MHCLLQTTRWDFFSEPHVFSSTSIQVLLLVRMRLLTGVRLHGTVFMDDWKFDLLLCFKWNCFFRSVVTFTVLPPVGLFEIQGLFRTKCYYACSRLYGFALLSRTTMCLLMMVWFTTFLAMVWYCGELNHNSHARLGSAMIWTTWTTVCLLWRTRRQRLAYLPCIVGCNQ